MTTIFIAGSITIRKLNPLVIERIKKIVDKKFKVIVGDANGVDSSVQRELLQMSSKNTTVYSSSPKPRNNLGSWPVNVVKTDHPQGTRAFFTAKDIQMAEDADCGLMVWDSKSTGTLNNVIELLNRNKSSVVFINKTKEFLIIKSVDDFQLLIKNMTTIDLEKADEKIKFRKKMDELKNQQITLI
ncbi:MULTISPECIES: hypothetical protein [Providencia]|uniref:hypothetical protein n=1 Tax=Providencia TaxID=586 RepID=UPI0008399324|nr:MULTISPECIES: hypothetical protein [Providencia]NIH22127.1 hypothetical protein [Providencia heimbachae]UEK60824.1 hypothetical protein LL668_06725 [Providencia rettgeri]